MTTWGSPTSVGVFVDVENASGQPQSVGILSWIYGALPTTQSVTTSGNALVLNSSTPSTYTFNQYYEFGSATQGGMGLSSFSLSALGSSPTPVAVLGTNINTGVLRFNAVSQSAQVRLIISDTWVPSGPNIIEIRFRSAATTGNIVWNVATASTPSVGGNLDPAFNTAQVV